MAKTSQTVVNQLVEIILQYSECRNMAQVHYLTDHLPATVVERVEMMSRRLDEEASRAYTKSVMRIKRHR